MRVFKEILNLYSFSLLSKILTYQRWYFGTPFEYVEKFIPTQGAIIDLGCGWGMFSNLMAIKSSKRQVIGVDLDESKILWAKRTVKPNRKNITFKKADLGSINIPNVNSIVAYDVLHHLDSETQLSVLRQCLNKLSSGGVLVIKENDVVPFHKLQISRLVEFIALGAGFTLSDKILFRSRSDWIRILEQIGFEILHHEHIKTVFGFHVPHSLFVCKKLSDTSN